MKYCSLRVKYYVMKKYFAQNIVDMKRADNYFA